MKKTIPTIAGSLIVVLIAGVAGASVLFFSQDTEETFKDKNEVTTREDLDLEEEKKYFDEENEEDITIDQWEKELTEIANKLSEIQGLKGELKEELLEEVYLEMIQAKENYEIDFSEITSIEIEDYGGSFRIGFYRGDSFPIAVYGIDIDKERMEVIESGPLG